MIKVLEVGKIVIFENVSWDPKQFKIRAMGLGDTRKNLGVTLYKHFIFYRIVFNCIGCPKKVTLFNLM